MIIIVSMLLIWILILCGSFFDIRYCYKWVKSKFKKHYWTINKDGRLVALRSFTINDDTYGYDVEVNDVGAYIPTWRCNLPPQSEKFWVEYHTKIYNSCTFNSGVYVSDDCVIDNSQLGVNVRVKRNSTIMDSMIGDNSVIGVENFIKNSIVKSSFWSLSNVSIVNSMIGDNSAVHTDAILNNSKVHSGVSIRDSVKLTSGTVYSNSIISSGLTLDNVQVPPNIELQYPYERDPDIQYLISNMFCYITAPNIMAYVYQVNDVPLININNNIMLLIECDSLIYPDIAEQIDKCKLILIKSKKM